MNEQTILDVIRELINRADEASAKWKQDTQNNMEFGRALAFCEALSIIKWDFVGDEAVEKTLGFDIAQRFLS